MTFAAALDPADATREVFWNIGPVWLMYVLLAPAVGISAWGVYRHVRKWRAGRPAARFDRPWDRIRLVVRHVLLQQATLRDRWAGVSHLLLFWGMVTLTAATSVVFVHHDLNLRIMQGRFYLYFQSLFVDVLGLWATMGVGVLAARRWMVRPGHLVQSREATGLLVLLFVILVTGFLIEGWRIAATGDPWRAWSPVGGALARLSTVLMSHDQIVLAHRAFWWLHLVLVLGLIAWAPYTKLLHLLTAPLNIYTANLDAPGGSLKTIDFESAASFGVNSLEQFTWKDLLDLDACTECGRCTSVCPANAVGKRLSPRDLILDMQRLLDCSDLSAAGEVVQRGEPAPAFPIIDRTPALSPEALWQCTTCAACVETCSVAIEQLPKIIDLRRFEVMERAEFPHTLREAMSSLEERGHPFRGTQFSRLDWTQGLDVPQIEDVDDLEVLLWVGCGGALMERNQRSTRALAQLLTRAHVKYAILGRGETCTGDPARRIGHEFLFESLARQNIETFRSHRIRTIVTQCPHCFHTFRNEYPRLGGEIEVLHHTTYLARLIGDGRLVLDTSSAQTITFHDPCYLGRHNGITREPRDLLRRAARKPLTEMARHGTQSFCCGGGGGMSFVDEAPDQRVNQERARQALASGADMVAVGCPFCTTMLEDGLNAVKGDRRVIVKDVAEILWDAATGPAESGGAPAES